MPPSLLIQQSRAADGKIPQRECSCSRVERRSGYQTADLLSDDYEEKKKQAIREREKEREGRKKEKEKEERRERREKKKKKERGERREKEERGESQGCNQYTNDDVIKTITLQQLRLE